MIKAKKSGKEELYDFTKENKDCPFHGKKVCMPHDMLRRVLEETKSRDIEDVKKKTNCGTEICVLNKLKDHLGHHEVERTLSENYKPKGPAGETEWLSNQNIDSVLDQAQKKYADKHFKHIGFQMRDFRTSEFKRSFGFSLDDMDWKSEFDRGYRTFGTVFNTDTSHGRGIHWFAVFGDFSRKPYTVEYFNSSGEPPLPEIRDWMLEFASEMSKKFNSDVQPIVVSDMDYQKDSFSCGTYSLYYIISRLHGTEYNFFAESTIDDSFMMAFRRFLFR